MQKLLLAGSGPLPNGVSIKTQTAFGLRTWQFLSSAKKFTGKVLVLLLDDESHYQEAPAFNEIESIECFGKQIEVVRVDKNSGDFLQTLGRYYREFNPTVCAGINLMPAFYLAQLEPDVPFWADLNGWSLAEAQSQAFVEQDDAYIPIIWSRERRVLRTADQISVVSNEQKICTIGQLGAAGRLNHKTESFELVHAIPNANEIHHLPKNSAKKFTIRKGVLEDAFIVFFSGAYNTWLDWETLFLGLETAMKKNPRIFFVSTGSGVPGLSNNIFDQFKAKINKSKFKDRFIFLGWLTNEELHQVYTEVDTAINLDRDNTETQFGARNRINEWLVYEVPVVSTVGTEITRELAVEELLIPVKLEHTDNLAKQIEFATKHDLQKMAKEAKKFAEKNYSYAKTMEKFSSFLSRPTAAPDKDYELSMRPNIFRRIFFKIKQNGVLGALRLVFQKIR